MKVKLFVIAALCSALTLIASFSFSQAGHSQTTKGAASNDGLSTDERDLLNEINQARANPQVYAAYLEKLRPLFKGKEYRTATLAVTTVEGWDAVEDAIKFLRAAKPLGPLSPSRGLCLASMSHVKDQSGTGATGHKGNDNTLVEERVRPYGTWQGGIGENLTYGDESAREKLLTWLIDDGFLSRGHRRRLMSPDYKVAGVCCGPHPQFKSMCAITLAGGFTDLHPPKTDASTQTKAAPSTTKSASPAKSSSSTKSRIKKTTRRY